MNEKHWDQPVLLAALLVMLASTGSSSAVNSETTKSRQPVSIISPREGSLSISGVTVTKGSSRESVMRQLSNLYELQKLKSAEAEEDSWLISEKQQSDNYIGIVSLAEDRMRRVARFRKWTQDGDSVELAQRLCDVLERFTSERGRQANIDVRATDSGKVSVRGMEMVFGDKRVSVNVISRNDMDSKPREVHLDEVVQ